ncbi:MAG: hypothetical protein AAGM21_12160 [Pseudomonadota bacterium]
MVEITDRKSAEAWLTDKPREIVVAFAARAALRSLPGIGRASQSDMETLPLRVLRATLTSGVAAVGSTPEVIENARSAANSAARSIDALSAALSGDAAEASARSAHSAANHPGNSASAAALSANSAAAADLSARSAADLFAKSASAAFSATSVDALSLEKNGVEVFTQPLWPDGGIPAFFQEPYAVLSGFWDADEKTWGFWQRWYEGMLNGKPLPWELQREVALIDNEVCEAGPEAVAEKIAEIEADWARDQSKINESLTLDEDRLLYTARHSAPSNAKRLELHLSRVDDALDDLTAIGGNNGLTEGTVEHRIIKRLVKKYSDDPERVAFDLRDVSQSIERQINTGEYPDSEPFRLLQAATTACVSTVCDMEPAVAAELERVYDKPSEAPDLESVEIVGAALQLSIEVLDDSAAATTHEDIEELLRGRIIDGAQEKSLLDIEWSAKELRSIVFRRQISRLWQIARDTTRVEKLAELFDSKHAKAARLAGLAGGVTIGFWQAIIILGRLLGILLKEEQCGLPEPPRPDIAPRLHISHVTHTRVSAQLEALCGTHWFSTFDGAVGQRSASRVPRVWARRHPRAVSARV